MINFLISKYSCLFYCSFRLFFFFSFFLFVFLSHVGES